MVSVFREGGDFKKRKTVFCTEEQVIGTKNVHDESLRTPIRVFHRHQGVKSGLSWIQQYIKA